MQWKPKTNGYKRIINMTNVSTSVDKARSMFCYAWAMGSQSGSRNRIYKWCCTWQLAVNNTTARAYVPVIGGLGTETKRVCSNHTHGYIKINRQNMLCVLGLFISLRKFYFAVNKRHYITEPNVAAICLLPARPLATRCYRKSAADWLLYLGHNFRFGSP